MSELALFNELTPLAVAIARQESDRCASYLRGDLRSAALEALWSAIRDHSQTHPNFKAYVRVRVHGAVLDELRRYDPASRRRRAREEYARFVPLEQAAYALADGGLSPESLCALAERERLLRDALPALTKRERAVVHHLSEGRSQRAAARQDGVTDCAINQVRARVVRKLRRALGGRQ